MIHLMLEARSGDPRKDNAAIIEARRLVYTHVEAFIALDGSSIHPDNVNWLQQGDVFFVAPKDVFLVVSRETTFGSDGNSRTAYFVAYRREDDLRRMEVSKIPDTRSLDDSQFTITLHHDDETRFGLILPDGDRRLYPQMHVVGSHAVFFISMTGTNPAIKEFNGIVSR